MKPGNGSFQYGPAMQARLLNFLYGPGNCRLVIVYILND